MATPDFLNDGAKAPPNAAPTPPAQSADKPAFIPGSGTGDLPKLDPQGDQILKPSKV